MSGGVALRTLYKKKIIIWWQKPTRKITQKTLIRNTDIFNRSNKKLIIKEDKF